MVCPVYIYKARSREVYFPSGTTWYDIYSGQAIEGGQTLTVNAPYNRMPLYAAAGSILPMGEIIQNTTQNQKDLTIYVYEGQDGSFDLYEDEGTNYNYEKGAYSLIPFVYNNEDNTLTVGKRKGEFSNMNKVRNFRIIKVGKTQALGIDRVVFPKTIVYNGEAQTVSLHEPVRIWIKPVVAENEVAVE
jgi:alpha-D-xyloside xylohydrolase